MANRKNKDHATAIRKSVSDLIDESERYRKEAGQLRLAAARARKARSQRDGLFETMENYNGFFV